MESGLYCELTDKTLHDGYIEYTLLYDMIANRITIDEVRAENGVMRLVNGRILLKKITLPKYQRNIDVDIKGRTGFQRRPLGQVGFCLCVAEGISHQPAEHC